MILVAVGTSEFPFDRLLKYVDDLCCEGVICGDEVVAQSGCSTYVPASYKTFDRIPRDEYQRYVDAADVLITHAGTGSVIPALKLGKKVIVVPRRGKLGEHNDDHQFELAEMVSDRGLALCAYDFDELRAAIACLPTFVPTLFPSNTQAMNRLLIDYVESAFPLKVLMLGNDSSVRGGITSVISQICSFDWESRGVELRFIPTYVDRSRPRMVAKYARACAEAAWLARSWKPDVAYIHMSHRGSYVRASNLVGIFHSRRIPVVVHLHGSEFQRWYSTLDESRKTEVRDFLRGCARVIVLGESWERRIRKIEPAARLEVLPNSVDTDVEQTAWREGNNRILFLGALVERKGAAELIDAIKLLSDQGALCGWKLVVAGDGPEGEALKRQCTALGLEDVIDFVGWVNGDEKEQLLRGCQLLALPSYNEGLPVAVLEALAHGLPVVATDVGDVSSAVVEGMTGRLVPPRDARALADAIQGLISSRSVWESASNRAREIALNRFDARGYADSLCSIFQSVASHSGEEKDRSSQEGR